MIIRRLILAALSILAPVATGQEDDANLRTTLVTYAPGELPEGFVAFFRNGGEILEFKANAGGLGDPVRYQGPKRLILRVSREEFALPPEKMKPPVGFVDLPQGCNNILLLAAPAAEGKLRLIPYDVAPKNLAPGEYKFFNFSHSVVSVILDSQKFTMSPSEDRVVKDAGWKTQPKVMELKIATVKDSKATLVNQTMWEHWPDKRQVVFFFNGRRKSEPIGFMCFAVEAPLRFGEEKP